MERPVSARRICVVTGSRAEYGLLYWLMKEIQQDGSLALQVIATGAHLSPEFGLTYKTIEQDGFRIDEKIEMLLSSDTPVGIAKSIGLGVIGFAGALGRLKPDIMVVLGDRFELLAATIAAMTARIPIAHIHGGELTEGALDDCIRHAITKMSQLHFVAAGPYRSRVMQMGEPPDKVLNLGSPGLDNIKNLRLLNRAKLEAALGFSLGSTSFLVTYHPETLSSKKPVESFGALLKALDRFPEARIIFTMPNADEGGRGIASMIKEYAARRKGVYAAISLGQRLYLSALKNADVVIGNSSSALTEAPSFKKPAVNIGGRQKGRLRAASVIDSAGDAASIEKAVRKALSPEFRGTLKGMESPYGKPGASIRIKEHLKTVDLKFLTKKKFYDIGI